MPDTDMQDSDESLGEIDIFREPAGYYAEKKPSSYQSYTLESGYTFNLRLIGHSPLWGHHLWPASTHLTSYLSHHREALTQNRTILELGAGVAVPSLFCALPISSGGGGARIVVASDYPDSDLVDNIQLNLDKNLPSPTDVDERVAVAQGYVWGASVEQLTIHLGPAHEAGKSGFDTLILSDTIFNHSQHAALAATIRRTLKRVTSARALVWFTPHRPWLLEQDLAFFEVLLGATEGEGKLEVRKVVEHLMERPMFLEDPGDETLRRTVFGYEVLWADLQ